MARIVNASVLAEIDNDSVSMCHLVYFGLSTAVYMTDASHDLSYNSNTYSSSSDLLSIDAVSETSDIRVNSINISLSGVAQNFTSAFLSGGYIGKQVIIYRAFLDSSGDIIGVPVVLYDGRIDGFDMSETENESTINVAISSHWADFEKKAGRYTNPNSQALFFTGDKGFDFAAVSVKDLKWGRA
jgi:hypothetical protein